MCIFVFMGFSLTIIQDAKANSASLQCGTGTECYSVPAGCGVGVGCNRVYCTDVKCPDGSTGGSADLCFYCVDPE